MDVDISSHANRSQNEVSHFYRKTIQGSKCFNFVFLLITILLQKQQMAVIRLGKWGR